MTCESKLKKLLNALDCELQKNNLDEKEWRKYDLGCFMDEEESYLEIRKAVLEAEGD